MVLSPRLQLIFEQLRPGFPVWDFCCDHGYVGKKALESGQFPAVYFVDQVPHIIENLRRDLILDTRAFFYAQPAETLKNSMDGNIVIAGVGAERILKIIQATVMSSHNSLPQILILGPQKDEGLIQSFGEDNKNLFKMKVLNFKEGTRHRQLFILESIHDCRVY